MVKVTVCIGSSCHIKGSAFVIGVLQDSTETALNSSSDALFTAAACLRAKRLEAQALQKSGK